MIYFAHSRKGDVPEQGYASHVHGVLELVNKYLHEMAAYAKLDERALSQVVQAAACYHDLGKLDKKNQEVLSGRKVSGKLPLNHADAGAALLLSGNHPFVSAAWAVCAHHVGYRDLALEINKEEQGFRDTAICDVVNESLVEYVELHQKLVKSLPCGSEISFAGEPAVFYRMVLSCLADADHTDTGQHYGNYLRHETLVALRPLERLEKLNAFVAGFSTNIGGDIKRQSLRNAMYDSCRDAEVCDNISTCDSPVGSGKTTSVMAHLLKQAHQRGLRRIFVILPFTNIIQQSVNTYRRCLVLPGENETDVVAELHHRADFQSMEARHLTALWRAPIIVTTAVAFFETLASNRPSTLRRLHELPGSAIFVDESHAALPVKLLPITWQWIQTFADEWSCYWVLASGSLTRFWTIPEIAGTKAVRYVPEIVDSNLRIRLSEYESTRVQYRHDLVPKGLSDLAQWINEFNGPRLVIMNTVQSAAVLAHHMAKSDRRKVEHLSTALKPEDRDMTLKRIKERLKDPEDTDWALVATSCVEAGVDLSFRNGFRELGSLLSLLQAAGRVDREGTFKSSSIWTFQIIGDGSLITHPGMQESAQILKHYFECGVEIQPDLSTDSIMQEIRLYSQAEQFRRLLKSESELLFESVAADYNIIEANNQTVIVDEVLVRKLQYGKVDWREIQRASVQIPKYRLQAYHARWIIDNIYAWTLDYNAFLGYMAGVIQLQHMQTGFLSDK